MREKDHMARRILGAAVIMVQFGYGIYSLIRHDPIVALECLAGILLVPAPGLIDRKLKLGLPEPLYLIYFCFLFAAIFLGSGLGFYELVPRWDDILHSMSGALLTALGFTILLLYGKRSKRLQGEISAALMGVFAFCFALAVGAVWEIYEYTGDGILKMSMQRFLAADGSGLVGRAALYDTMKDLIVDAGSSLVTALAGSILISRRRKRDLIQKTGEK